MNSKNQYILLFSGTEWYNGLSKEQLQEHIDKTRAWFERVAATGKVKGGQALVRNGATLRSGRVISDGPYAESKEALGGFMILEADSLEEAIAVAKGNPVLAFGTTIDIRPLTDECPLDARARQLGIKSQLAELAA